MNNTLVAMNRADCFCLTTAAFTRLRNNMSENVQMRIYEGQSTLHDQECLIKTVLNVHSKLNNKQGQNIVKTR